MKDKNKKTVIKTPSVDPCADAPENSFTLVNKYGTYEIQPTADTDNQYPAIAQGYNKKQQKFEGDRPEAEDGRGRCDSSVRGNDQRTKG